MTPEGQLNGELRANLAITPQEARQGTSRILNLPGNRQVSVQVPANAYSGQEIRLPGQGVNRQDGSPGELILTINVTSNFSSGDQPYSNYGGNGDSETEFIPPPPPPPVQRFGNAPTPTFYEPQNSYTPPQPSYQAPQQSYWAQQSATFPQAPGIQPPAPRKKRPILLPVILVLVALLVIGGGIIIFANSRNTSNNNNTTTTQLTSAQTTATAQAKVTPTPTTPAVTPSPSVTTVNGIYTQATSGTPDINDPLSSQDTNNWYINNTDIGSCGFTGGTYHSTVVKTGYFKPCLDQASTYSNFTLQVQMTILKGDRGGLIFREDSTATKRYLLRVDQNGSFDVFVYSGNASADATSLQSGSSPAIHTGMNQTNLITVVARGADIYFYVNKTYMASIHDSTYSSGNLGFFAEEKTNPTDVSFANMEIWKL